MRQSVSIAVARITRAMAAHIRITQKSVLNAVATTMRPILAHIRFTQQSAGVMKEVATIKADGVERRPVRFLGFIVIMGHQTRFLMTQVDRRPLGAL
jgi:hypothetical protein